MLLASRPVWAAPAGSDLPGWFVVTSLGVLAALLLADLVLVSRRPREPSTREAALWVGCYVILALVFGLLLLAIGGDGLATQFYAGWLTEYSLSVDNLFVFLLIMARFRVPRPLQQQALMVGVLLALVLRGGVIVAGAAALDRFTWLYYLFGAFLLYTAVRLLRSSGEEEYEENRLIRRLRTVLPLTDGYAGSRLLVSHEGRRVWTPLVVVFAALGTTDLLFALDSIPAIFGLTRIGFLVFTANLFALMGLRQLYFLLGGLLERLVHLSTGLVVILAFVGVKLILEAVHDNALGVGHGGRPLSAVPTIPTWLSLTVIVAVLAVVTGTSLLTTRRTVSVTGDGAEEAPPHAA